MIEGGFRQSKSRFGRQPAARVLKFGDNFGILRRIRDHGDIPIILRRRPNERGATDVDIFNRFREFDILALNRRFKRIEVGNDQIYRFNAVRGGLRTVLRIISQRKQTAINLRVKRFHAPVQHFGKTRVIRDLAHLNPRFGQVTGSLACGEEFYAVAREDLDQA